MSYLMNDEPEPNFRPVILAAVVMALALFFALKANAQTTFNAENEIKISREREDLLLQQVKLLDYQISVLTERIMQ